jgi:mannose-6-phosphate isomerase
MKGHYKLINSIKHYEWGSTRLIPEFLGIENKENLPFAEMWMGTHSAGASFCSEEEFTRGHGDTGKKGEERREISLAEAAGRELDFLFKLLAVERPLSIQAHPNKAQAARGFERENREGLALDDPKRNYRDKNHKPEIICALSEFTLMAGFRRQDEIRAALKDAGTAAVSLLSAVDTSLSSFFDALYKLSKREIQEIASRSENALVKKFAAMYPCDPAVLAPVYLNVLTLKPQQAIFVPAGVLHAYISGFALELMASSDNVLRGGLTSKHVDIGELKDILDFSPFMPQIIQPPYSTLCDDFSLCELRSTGGEIVFTGHDAICIVTEGALRAGDIVYKKGESFFIPAQDGMPLTFSGNFTAFAACGT